MSTNQRTVSGLIWTNERAPLCPGQEDWNIVLFAGMERTSHWAALYFVLLMTFGNYILFNLLVAILVEGFSKQDELFDKNDGKVR